MVWIQICATSRFLKEKKPSVPTSHLIRFDPCTCSPLQKQSTSKDGLRNKENMACWSPHMYFIPCSTLKYSASLYYNVYLLLEDNIERKKNVRKKM